MSIVTFFKIIFFGCLNCWNFILSDLEETFINTRNDKFSLDHWQNFPWRSMAALRNQRKLAAISREIPEGSRISRGQNVLDPELTQDYISQVSEEIEGRVTKKLSKEFSKTESRILGALSKLDEFLLNPQVRTCSVAVQGTSRNAISKNRELMGIAPQTIPIPKWGFFLITLANSIAQRQKPTRTWWPKITLTWWQEPQKRFVTSLTRGQQLKKKSLLLPYYFVRQTKKGALHKSTSISQWEYPCDNWSRRYFVGASTIGDELQFSQFQ